MMTSTRIRYTNMAGTESFGSFGRRLDKGLPWSKDGDLGLTSIWGIMYITMRAWGIVHI